MNDSKLSRKSTSRKRHEADSDAAQFGFRWEQLDVARWISMDDGRKCLAILTDFKTLEIYVSATGRSVRVFDGGVELKA